MFGGPLAVETRRVEIEPGPLKDVGTWALFAPLPTGCKWPVRNGCGFRWDRCAKDLRNARPGSIRGA